MDPRELLVTECYLDDDGLSPEVQVIEGIPEGVKVSPQSLHVRVGPVYHESTPDPVPGVWVEYQETHDGSLPLGPVLLTPEVWRELNAAVEKRLRRWKYPRWKSRWKRSPGGSG